MRSVDDLLRDVHALIGQIPVIPYVARGASPRAIRLGPQVEDTFGHAPHEFVADPGLWPGLIHRGDGGFLAGEAPRGGDRRVVTYRALVADGGYRWFRDESVYA